MTTWETFKEQALKDPELKREYDALEGWYQEELAKQEAADRADAQERKSTPPEHPHAAYA